MSLIWTGGAHRKSDAARLHQDRPALIEIREAAVILIVGFLGLGLSALVLRAIDFAVLAWAGWRP